MFVEEHRQNGDCYCGYTYEGEATGNIRSHYRQQQQESEGNGFRRRYRTKFLEPQDWEQDCRHVSEQAVITKAASHCKISYSQATIS
jgi:hypothetical protein